MPPRRYRNDYGQLLEHAPYSQRDIHAPDAVAPREDHGDFVEIPIYSGPQMQPGDELYGPLVIEEPDTTVVVYPGDVVRVLPDQSYEILVGERS